MNNLICCYCKKQFGSHYYDVDLRVLTCGHSFCCTCVDKLITLKDNCPKCNYVLKALPSSDLPRNENLLAVTDVTFASTNVKCDSFEKFVSITSRNLEDLIICTNKVRNTAESLVLYSYDDSFDVKMVRLKQLFKVAKSNFKTLEPLFPKFGYIDLNIYPKNSEGDEAFLVEIMEKLAIKEIIYAAIVLLNGQLKYGNVTSDGDSILVNSLTLSERETESSYFWFNEFKSRFRNKFFPFLTFRFKGYISIELKFEFEIYDNWRDSQFIKHCTGESSFALKNAPYNCICDDTIEIANTIKDVPDNLDTIVNKDDVVICLLPSGRYCLRQFSNSKSSELVKNVIGKLKNKFSLTDIVYNKRILESGIVVHRNT